MAELHLLEKLAALNPESEIWWDSSPLLYPSWRASMLESAPHGRRGIWAEQLDRLYNQDKPEKMVFRGVTTNPRLSHIAITNDLDYWAGHVRRIIEQHPRHTVEDIYWFLYKEVVRRGAAMVEPLWYRSEKKYGYLSAQVDPRYVYDYQTMLHQALELSSIAPNVMIKIPGSMEGYEVIEELTARGIPTNNTISFSVPQYLRLMDAVSGGLERAGRAGIDLSGWRSVVTHMSSRFGALGELAVQAEARGIRLTETDILWADLMVFKRAYWWNTENNHPSKMLQCSMRVQPGLDDGTRACWHIEKLAGAACVYTCPPAFIGELMRAEQDLAQRPLDPGAIHECAPGEVMNRLMRIPYFVKGYEFDGMRPEEFNTYTPFVATVDEFRRATNAMVDVVARQFRTMGKEPAYRSERTSHPPFREPVTRPHARKKAGHDGAGARRRGAVRKADGQGPAQS